MKRLDALLTPVRRNELVEYILHQYTKRGSISIAQISNRKPTHSGTLGPLTAYCVEKLCFSKAINSEEFFKNSTRYLE